MITFIFSRNNLIGSKLISWGTKEEWQRSNDKPSHFWMVFGSDLIIESTLKQGVRLNYLPTFKTKNQIISALRPINDGLIYSEKVDKILDQAHGRKYDYPAIIYFAWRVLLKRFFGLSFPKRNKFNSAEKFFCNELYTFITGEKMSMQSPNGLMFKMLENEQFINCEI